MNIWPTLFIALSVLITQTLTTPALANNRESEDALLQNEALSQFTEFMAMVTYAGAGAYIAQPIVLTPEDEYLRRCKEDLADAKCLSKWHLVEQKKINVILSNPDSFDPETSAIKPSAEEKIRNIKSNFLYKHDANEEGLKSKARSVLRARLQAIEAAQQMGFFPKSVKIVRKSFALYFFSEAFARPIVWYTFDAKPGFAAADDLILKSIE